MPTKIAIVGLGKIAQDQHLPAIKASNDWELGATVSLDGALPDIDNYLTLDELFSARPDIEVVSLCVPPAPRFELALATLAAGRHLMLEKPPGATLSECDMLSRIATQNGLSLYATWHSREARQVDAAAAWLKDKQVSQFHINWRESVRRWHPNQEWIWEPAGMGVFDPGINALSILTKILPEPVRLSSASLSYPENRQMPIAAQLRFKTLSGGSGEADFDWREEGDQTWIIRIQTDSGLLELGAGGEELQIDNQQRTTDLSTPGEYARLYKKMHQLVRTGQSETDLRPFQLVADAFSIARRESVAPFES